MSFNVERLLNNYIVKRESTINDFVGYEIDGINCTITYINKFGEKVQEDFSIWDIVANLNR